MTRKETNSEQRSGQPGSVNLNNTPLLTRGLLHLGRSFERVDDLPFACFFLKDRRAPKAFERLAFARAGGVSIKGQDADDGRDLGGDAFGWSGVLDVALW